MRGGCEFCRTLPEFAEGMAGFSLFSESVKGLMIRRSLVRVQPPPSVISTISSSECLVQPNWSLRMYYAGVRVAWDFWSGNAEVSLLASFAISVYIETTHSQLAIMQFFSKWIAWLGIVLMVWSALALVSHRHSDEENSSSCQVCVAAHSVAPTRTAPAAKPALQRIPKVAHKPLDGSLQLIVFALYVRPPPPTYRTQF